MIELKEGISVVTSSGEQVGKIDRFVLDPATNEVTHIVIGKGGILSDDRVVPFHMVRASGEDRIVLNDDIGSLDQLPPFEETHFVRVNEDVSPADREMPTAPVYYWYPSSVNIGYPAFAMENPTRTETTRNIPETTVALKEGSNVLSADGDHVGDVERLFLESDSNKVSHFLVSQGLFFKDRKLIPAHWVSSIEENQVHLAVPSRLLERLPSYQE